METATDAEPRIHERPPNAALVEFEQIYRANVGALTAYFGRRCADPQTVADLTSETVVRAASGFGGFDPRRGSARAWMFGIASHVYARHCELLSNGRTMTERLAGLADLPADEIDELAERIDAQRIGRYLLECCADLSDLERAAFELVDLVGLTPKEAASALGIPRGALRMRLSRARARLRKEHDGDE